MSKKKLTGEALKRSQLFAVVHQANEANNRQYKKGVVTKARLSGLIGTEDLLDPDVIDSDLECIYRAEALELAEKQFGNRNDAREAVIGIVKLVRGVLGGNKAPNADRR